MNPCAGDTALGPCDKKPLYVISIVASNPQITVQSCGIHIGQVVKRYANAGYAALVGRIGGAL